MMYTHIISYITSCKIDFCMDKCIDADTHVRIVCLLTLFIAEGVICWVLEAEMGRLEGGDEVGEMICCCIYNMM